MCVFMIRASFSHEDMERNPRKSRYRLAKDSLYKPWHYCQAESKPLLMPLHLLTVTRFPGMYKGRVIPVTLRSLLD